MRIAQVVPPWLPVPPKGYGGIESVAYHLTEGLVRRGHQVTLFASGDSQTSAQLSFYYPKALGNVGTLKKDPLKLLFQIYPVFKQAAEFDIIHSHGMAQSLFFAEFVDTPTVHTIHGTIDPHETTPENYQARKLFRHQPTVSISNSQREGIPQLNYVATVYNGIDLSQFEFGDGKGGYLAWLGRITPKKGVVEAIEVARKANMRLKIAAFVDPVDQQFFEQEVRPLIDGEQISLLGQLDSKERSNFLGGAFALLFPIKWEEPFGLVMVEAMACGTPVIAFNRGSVPEVIKDGETGYIIKVQNSKIPNSKFQVQNLKSSVVSGKSEVGSSEDKTKSNDKFIIQKSGIDGMLAAVQEIDKIDRRACRRWVEEKFTIDKMVEGYEQVYQKVVGSK